MLRRFVGLDGTPQASAALDASLRTTPEQLGPVRARHTVPAASRPVAALLAVVGVVVVLAVATATVLVVLGALPVAAVLCPLAIGVAVAVLVGVGLAATHDSRGIEVRAHGLVVGSRPVPFATMDPGRMVWATSARAARSVVTLARCRRVAGGECLLLNGTDGPDAVDDWRGLGGRYDPLPRAPRLDTPFVWWALGPRDVGAFVRDLEAAMVADGYPVHGLADHLARHRTDVPAGREALPRRAPHDPPLWRARPEAGLGP